MAPVIIQIRKSRTGVGALLFCKVFVCVDQPIIMQVLLGSRVVDRDQHSSGIMGEPHL